MQSAAQTTATDLIEVASTRHRLFAVAGRYALSACGPVCISGAHFVAAVLVLNALSPVHFGLFSFVMTIVPFCIGAAAALVGAPTTIGIRKRGHVDEAELATFQKANWCWRASPSRSSPVPSWLAASRLAPRCCSASTAR
ncbi:MAG: hypothetical protein WDN08_06980 [Rhizomicrobium sp.]